MLGVMKAKSSTLLILLVVALIAIPLGLGFTLLGGRKPTGSPTTPTTTTSPASIFSQKVTNEIWNPPTLHPWQMVHGNYNHTGYTNVAGPTDARLKWKSKLTSGGKGAPPNSVAVASNGTVYVGSPNGLFAFDQNGKQKWTTNATNIQGPAISADGKTIYVAGVKQILAIDATNGAIRWSFATGGETIFGPILGPDETLYQGSWDGYFYAVTPQGNLKWKYKTNGAVSYPASVGKDGTVYLGGGDAHAGPDSNFYAFNPDGTLKWKYDTHATRVGSPSITGNLIFIPAAPTLLVLDTKGNLVTQKGPQVRGISTDCGQPPLPPCQGFGTQNSGQGQSQQQSSSPNQQNQGSQDKGDIAGILSPAIGKDGIIYVGNSQGIALALSSSYDILWKFNTGADPDQANFYGIPSFPIVDTNGTMYFGSVDGYFYAVDKNGKLVWKYKTDGGISEASPAMDAQGTIYFTSHDGYVYALGK